jgi:hypothetical protein
MTTLDVAGDAAWTDEAGGSVEDSVAEDDDSVDEVEVATEVSVEGTADSALEVTTLGGPTAAMTSATRGQLSLTGLVI